MSSQNGSLVASSLYDLTGLVAVVTGGGTGVGLMITRGLVANGAKVYILGRRLEVLRSVAEAHGQNGAIIPIQVDLTIKEDITKITEEIEAKEPNGIHILVNNAGVLKERDTTEFWTQGEPDSTSATAIAEHMLKSTPESWSDSFQTNVTATFFTSAAFIPLLAKGAAHKRGYSTSIVNVASIAGLMRSPWPGYYAYQMSKAAMLHLSHVLGLSLSQVRIRVNTIAPGIFPSAMNEGARHAEAGYLNDNVPAGRAGSDQEMVNALLSLVGPASGYVNGQTLYPDGGIVLTQAASIS